MDSTSSTMSSVPHCCHIIPVTLLQSIAKSSTASSNSRAVANKTIAKIQNTHRARVTAQIKSTIDHAHPPQPHHSIIPGYVFQAVLDSDRASEHSKAQAKKDLALLPAT